MAGQLAVSLGAPLVDSLATSLSCQLSPTLSNMTDETTPESNPLPDITTPVSDMTYKTTPASKSNVNYTIIKRFRLSSLEDILMWLKSTDFNPIIRILIKMFDGRIFSHMIYINDKSDLNIDLLRQFLNEAFELSNITFQGKITIKVWTLPIEIDRVLSLDPSIDIPIKDYPKRGIYFNTFHLIEKIDNILI